MPSLKPDQLWQELEAGALRPVYLFFGPEEWLKDRAVAEIEKLALAGAMPEFNCDRFRGREARVDEVVAAARTLPMMAPRRLVVVKELEAWRSEEQERLAEYLEEPVATTCLVLVAAEVDGRRRMARAAAQTGAVVEFKLLYPAQLSALVRELAKSHGKSIEPEAIELLVELKGNSLQILNQELAKLSLYLDAEKRITREHVSEAVADTKLAGIFEFTDAVGAHQVEAALRTFRRMMDAGEAPLAVLGMVARHFRLIWKILELEAQGRKPAEMAAALGLNRFVLEKTYLPQSRNFRLEDLGRLSALLADLDYALKSSRSDREALFERMLFELCRS